MDLFIGESVMELKLSLEIHPAQVSLSLKLTSPRYDSKELIQLHKLVYHSGLVRIMAMYIIIMLRHAFEESFTKNY